MIDQCTFFNDDKERGRSRRQKLCNEKEKRFFQLNYGRVNRNTDSEFDSKFELLSFFDDRIKVKCPINHLSSKGNSLHDYGFRTSPPPPKRYRTKKGRNKGRTRSWDRGFCKRMHFKAENSKICRFGVSELKNEENQIDLDKKLDLHDGEESDFSYDADWNAYHFTRVIN